MENKKIKKNASILYEKKNQNSNFRIINFDFNKGELLYGQMFIARKEKNYLIFEVKKYYL